MKLWIRSQNKCKLRNAEVINYYYENGKHIIDCNGYPAGTYKSKERCLEIIDEIQNIICRSGMIVFKDIDITNLTAKDIEPFKSITWNSSSLDKTKSEVTIHNAEVIVYEMPPK